MQKKITYVLNILLMAAVLAVTFYVLLKDQDIAQIMAAVSHVHKGYLFLGIVCSLLFLVLQSISLKVMLTSLGEKIHLYQGMKYTFIEFLFNAITPSASGGQPMQILYMKQDGISIGGASVALLFWTIMYKIVLVLVEGFVLLFYPGMAVQFLHGYEWLFVLGIAVNVVSILLYSIVVFSKNGAKNLVYGATWICHKLHIVKRKEKLMHRLDHMLENYQDGAVYMRTHWKLAGEVLFITLLQRLIFFAITWCIYRALGFTQYNLLQIIILQSFVAVCIDILPLPGGVGVNEGFSVSLFAKIMGSQAAVSAMLLSRGVNFYFMVIIGALVTMGAQIQIIHRKHQQMKKGE